MRHEGLATAGYGEERRAAGIKTASPTAESHVLPALRQTSRVTSAASLTFRGRVLEGEIIKLTAGHCILWPEVHKPLGGGGLRSPCLETHV